MDLAKAAGILTDLAMKGHPYAQVHHQLTCSSLCSHFFFLIFSEQFALGGMYYNGSGVTQSFQRAYTLYKVL